MMEKGLKLEVQITINGKSQKHVSETIKYAPDIRIVTTITKDPNFNLQQKPLMVEEIVPWVEKSLSKLA